MALFANSTLILLSLLMGVRLLQKHRTRPRPHTLWYAIGLLLTATAALPEVWREVLGSLPTLLWWTYWIAASTLVGSLSVGTAFLISQRVGRITLGVIGALALGLTIATLLTAGPAPAVFTESTFTKAPNSIVKLPFLLQNIIGVLIIIGGAVVSFVKTRAWHPVWITLGTLLFAGGGASSGLLHYSELFYFTQTAGIVLLYMGVAAPTAGVPAPARATQV